MENGKSELEKKIEMEQESTTPDSAILDQASEIPPTSKEETEPVTSLENLIQMLEEKTQELEELKDRYLRVCAEFDNYRKRTHREIKELQETATENLIKDLLPVLDNFERALMHAPDPDDAFVSGVRMVFAQLKEVLVSRGLTVIEAQGKNFDPNMHEALAQAESELPEGTIIQEYEKGYRLGKKILRHAKVVISKPSEDFSKEDNNANNNNSVNHKQ
ncbi:MAG TPA: nucleotide exchange factor GrpE [Candidatus Hydrogenedens sp.]|nr:nucleotide exchange factor GrpE [Candidatus Hydrogenedens sp.]HOL20096.1 nucleotide exchange factor GrpE [Candidatus Hydrogenedens sp.]HPP59894.1 nucleotide exchange factor GrpE [Candidatus Hydrogenedens sp.]